jgi:recombination protein RecR
MAQSLAGPEIERLIQLLARVPGLGPRSARRATLHLMKKREELLGPLSEAMRIAAERIITCTTCGNLDTSDPCTLCRDERRDRSIIIVVESVGDLWALERAGTVRGAYHVLGATLSAMDGIGPEDLALPQLFERAASPDVREVILAMNATVEGQTTAHYITDMLKEADVAITRLAHGVPVGGELDYLDEGTLAAAMMRRSAT